MIKGSVGGFASNAGFLASLKPKFAAAIALDVLSPTRQAFRDLTGVATFDVPLGLAYDPYSSTINDIVFRPWDGTDEALTVSLLPPSCAASARDDEWYDSLEGHAYGVADLVDCRRFRPRGRPCLAGERPRSRTAPSHVALIRGPRLEVFVEHRCTTAGGAGVTAAMSKVLASLELPSKVAAGAPVTNEELLEACRAALRAKQEGRLDDSAGLAVDAVRLGRRAAALATGDLGRFGAAIMVIAQMASPIALVSRSVPLLRSAEHLLLRCLRTIEVAADAALDEARDFLTPLVQELYTATHTAYEDLRRSNSRGVLPEFPLPTNAVQAADVRIPVLLDYAQDLTGAMVPPYWAQTCVDFAVQDGLLCAAWWNAAAAGLLQDKTPPSPELRLAALTTLQSILEMRIDHERVSGPVSPETTELMVEIARMRTELRPESEVPSVEADLASALALHAGSLVSIGDAPSLDDAAAAAEEAGRLLESVPDRADAHGRVEYARAVLYLRRNAFGRAVHHGRRAAAAAGTAGLTELAAAALTVAARALLAARRAEEAVAEFERMPKEEQVGPFSGSDVRVRARAATGEVEGALWELAVILSGNSIKVEALSAETFAALVAGADILEGTDGRCALQLLVAAHAIAMLWKASSLRAPADRIGFNEGATQLRLGADLVARLLDQGQPGEALLTADRLRAETLNQALGIGENNELAPEVPAVQQADAETSPRPPLSDILQLPPGRVVDNLAATASEIRRQAYGALAALGVPAPPEWPELSAVLRQIGAAALVPQPTADGIRVFLAHPDGTIHSHRAEISADELSNLITAAQAQLDVKVATRSGDGIRLSPVVDASRSTLDDALRHLHRALVEPVQNALGLGLPLFVVPYRELALVPWSLLLDSDGSHLCERHPLSLLPSLATLMQLRQRRVQRPRPEAAYVVGAPTSASDLGLIPLPGAREEAEYVAAAIHGAGVPSQAIRLRRGVEATRASYHAEAAGADFVHLACHAALRTPAQASPLFLAASPGDDGVVFAPEIAEIGLSDALVFLSACQTGLGRPTADGIIGLGRAFLEAGARCVLLSLWEVSDESTAALVRHFIGRLLGPERLDVAGALQAAMLATRADLQADRITERDGTACSDHPTNWAPFIAMGDGSFAYRD